MAYELYQSKYKGFEIDNLLDDVNDIKPIVDDIVTSGYDSNKVKMSDGTVLPVYLNTQMASKADIQDFKTGAQIAQMISDAAYVLPEATTSSLGGVKPDGTTITVDADGTIHGANTYILPEATTSTLGGVKPDGTTITVDADGTIHGASSIDELNDIGDVDISNAKDKQALMWDAANSKWVNSKDNLVSANEVMDKEIVNKVVYFDYGKNPAEHFIVSNNQECNIQNGKIIFSTYASPSDGLAKLKTPLNNQQSIKVKRTLITGSRQYYFGYLLGTTLGGSDIYTSPTLSISSSDIDIDLTQYSNTTIYFTLKIHSEAGCNMQYRIDNVLIDVVNAEVEKTWLSDANGNMLAPNTLVEAIKNKNGKTLEELLAESGATPTWSAVANKPFESIGTGLSVDDNGALNGSSSDWPDISNKPFESIGTGLSVDSSGVLSATGGGGGINGDLYFGIDDYSEEEKVIGRWKNGKPLYRKVILDAPLNTSIEVNDLDNLVDLRWKQRYTNDSEYFSYGEANSSYVSMVYLSNDRKHLTLRSTTNFTSPLTIIITYTKTTDAPNSFKPSLMTNNALLPVAPSYDDYSDEEIVIGKWTNGKPIYRKVFQGLNITVSASSYNKTINISDLNIEFLLPQSSAYANTLENWRLGYFDVIRNPGFLTYYPVHNATINKIIIEYTKTTDAPNSFSPDMIKTIPLTNDVTDAEVNVAIDILKEA